MLEHVRGTTIPCQRGLKSYARTPDRQLSAARVPQRAPRCSVEEPCAHGGSHVAQVPLGRSGVTVPQLGIGAWSWGDASYWEFGQGYGEEECRQAYQALLSTGLGLVDTAEIYGAGKSEELLGQFMAQSAAAGQPLPQVATKFGPNTQRTTRAAVPAALRGSLSRLGVPKVDLYMIHWPGFHETAVCNEEYVEGLALAHQQGLCSAVGVSNFHQGRVRDASARLAQHGIPLASNQVQYSLLYRTPERNGVLEACREAGATLMAYSPLCQGLLTGKYTADGPLPGGYRSKTHTPERLRTIAPLLSTLEAVAKERGKSMAQVSLNWLMCKGALPIPGAKDGHQVSELAGAVGWCLSDGQVAGLDAAGDRVPTGPGAPLETM